MKKNIAYYIVAWAVVLALFNLITFLTPWVQKYSPSFWIGYAFITLMLIGHLVCAIVAFKADSAQKLFYNLSLIIISYISTAVSFIVGSVCMAVPFLPYWLGIIICAVVLAANVITLLMAKTAINTVSNTDKKIKENTLFIRSLTADAQTLISKALCEEARVECKKVYEAVRYSDPMANEVLAALEGEITIRFSSFAQAVTANDKELTAQHAKELIILLNERNNKLKFLK